MWQVSSKLKESQNQITLFKLNNCNRQIILKQIPNIGSIPRRNDIRECYKLYFVKWFFFSELVFL